MELRAVPPADELTFLGGAPVRRRLAARGTEAPMATSIDPTLAAGARRDRW